MTDNKYISLKVCGRPHENSGFNPLVYFNSPLFDVPDTVYSGFNEVSYFFSIIIEKTQVVYTLIMNNVRSCRGFRLGNLKIAMSIPKGYKISNGKTPYDTLISIKDFIITSCMTCKDPIRLVYEFNSGIISPTLLDDIAREFPLESATGPYHPMSLGGPKGYITLPEEQISLLLSDVQYAEFSPYGEIVVAQSVQATNYTPIVNLQVPRKSRFAIIVDGVEDGYVEEPNEEIPVRGKKDSKYYDNYQFSFCISDIRNGKNIPNVKIDEEKETISIDTSTLSSPKQVKVSIEFDAEAQGYFYTIKENFQLSYNQRVIQIKEDYSFILTGEDIARLANPEGFVPNITQRDRYIIEGKELIKNDAGEYFLKIKTKKVINTVPLRPQSDKVVKSKESDIYRVEVLLNARPEKEFLKVYDGSKLVQSSRVRYTMSGSNYRSVIYIPKSYEISNLEVSYDSPECVFKSGIVYDKRSETYTASHFEAQVKTFYERKIKHRMLLIVSIAALLIGMLCGGFVVYKFYPSIQRLANKNSKIQCEHCDKTFFNEEDYMSHLNADHLKHPCDDCSQRFLTREALQEHINTEHLKHVCSYCENEKRFATEDALTNHINREHLKYPCTKCDLRFPSKADLNKHIKENHPTQQTFKCDLCNESFDTEDALKWHKAHAPQYKCEECTRKNRRKVYWHTQELLNKHMQDVHGER